MQSHKIGRFVKAGTAAAALAVVASPMAQAATGGTPSENPGIVALTDGAGNQVCSAVLVNSEWALTFEGPMTCGNGIAATVDGGRTVPIVDRQYPDATPGESQAMLVHLSAPITEIAPAQFDSTAPVAGEHLEVAAFTGPQGNHQSQVGTAPITVKGHNAWISWYGVPEGMSLVTGSDSGVPILRDGKVVAFTGLVTEQSTDAEDFANVEEWVSATALQ